MRSTEKITFDNTPFIPVAALSEDVFTVSFSGLSKTYKLAGFRCGWIVMSGPKHLALNYIEGLNILSNMRLCSKRSCSICCGTRLEK